MLTPDARQRAARALAAAEVMLEAGAFDAVENLLGSVDTEQVDELQAARAERLHAEVSLSVAGGSKAAILRLLAAAERLRRVDSSLGYAAYLEALRTAFDLANPEVLQAVVDAMDDSPAPESPAVVELFVRDGRNCSSRDIRREQTCFGRRSSGSTRSHGSRRRTSRCFTSAKASRGPCGTSMAGRL